MHRRKEKIPMYKDWFQTNTEPMAEIIDLEYNYPQAAAILTFMSCQMDNYNAIVCSSKVLEEYFNASRSTISRAIKVLQEKGFIYVFKSGTSNVYAINSNVYWKNYGEKVYLSKFPANVLLTKSEQFESIKRLPYDKEKKIIRSWFNDCSQC